MRTILAAFAMFLSAFVMNANNVYCFDFESQATSPSEYREAYYIIAGPEVVSNPMKNGINTSEKVLFFTSQEGIADWGGLNVSLKDYTTTASVRYLYMKVRVEPDVVCNFAISVANDGTFYSGSIPCRIDGKTELTGEWREVGFTLDSDLTFDEIRINPNVATTFYIDDIRLCDEVVPEQTIDDLEPLALMDFEDENIDAWTSHGGGSIELANNPAKDPLVNNSEYTIKGWIPQGFEPTYDGAKLNVSGITTEDSRYLHVKYFHHQNELKTDQQALRVLIDGSTVLQTETMSDVDTWTDVTIDLGVGTFVQFLNFFVDGWWQNLYLDDIVIDGSPNRSTSSIVNSVVSDEFEVISNNGRIMVSAKDENAVLEVFNVSGVLVDRGVGTLSVEQPKGVYIVKQTIGDKVSVKKIAL